jgi:L-alanine-DL-glutamate epimerase-like enolase superfamily enzyme
MWLHREAWIVLLEAPGGRIGLGEAVLEPDATEVEETILARAVRETAGRAREGDLPDAEELELLGGPGRAFRAALDAARLDLAAELDPAPVPVNGTIAFAAPREGAEAALQAIEAGFTTLKLKAGAERETEDLVARVRAIRRAVGPEVRLRLDVNGAWDLPTAEERLEAVARFDLEYVEQPLAADDTAGAAELRTRVRVPLAADEAAYSAHAARRILAESAADVLVVKPARVGGPVAVAEIAAAAAGAGVPVVVSTLFETGIGIAAARACATGLPRGLAHGLATAGLLEHDLLAEPLAVESGTMAAPGGPGSGGLGVRLDEAALRRFASEAVEAAG